jgi:hypothetical protein
LTITGTGDQTPTVSPGVIPASPAELSLNAGMSRKGVPSGTISSSTLGSRSFAPTATGLLVEGASGLISVP